LLYARTDKSTCERFKVVDNAGPISPIFYASVDDAPPTPGAYVLAIELARPLTVALPGRPATRMSAGRYLYCGSARGPGGRGRSPAGTSASWRRRWDDHPP